MGVLMKNGSLKLSACVLTLCLSIAFLQEAAFSANQKLEAYRIAESEEECPSSLPAKRINDSPTLAGLQNGLSRLDQEREFGEGFDKWDIIVEAFPNLEKSSFEEHRYSRWTIERADFDGMGPSDYLLWLRQSSSGGYHDWYLAIRNGNKITYQMITGRCRGQGNTLIRLEESRSGNKKLFLDKTRIDDEVRDLDGDSKTDLLVHYDFEACNTKEIIKRFGEQHCSMADLVDFPVPYFWDGKKMSCNKTKASKFYNDLQKNLHLLHPYDATALKVKLKQRTGK
jgi:hypothetical protein